MEFIELFEKQKSSTYKEVREDTFNLNKLPESILLLLFCSKGVLFSPIG